jgi:hypothetical protein
VERHEGAPEGLLRTDDDLRHQRGFRGGAEERVAHPVEHVGDRREIDRHLVREPVGAAARQTAGVVRAAPLGVAQHLERAGHFEERRAAVVPGDVGVIPPRQLPVRALDLVRARPRRNA